MPAKKVITKKKRTPDQRAYLLSRIDARRQKVTNKLEVESKQMAKELSILYHARIKLNPVEQLKLFRRVRKLFLKVYKEIDRNVLFGLNAGEKNIIDINKRANKLGNNFEDVIRYVFSMEQKGQLINGFNRRVFRWSIKKSKKERKK